MKRIARYLALMLGASIVHGQNIASHNRLVIGATRLPDAPLAKGASEASTIGTYRADTGVTGISSLRSFSVDRILPPQTVREKFITGLQDSFSYYSAILVGAEAGIHQASNQYPAFRQGAAGYGRYYWHSFADQADENLWVVSILPSTLREDSRYYRLGRGGFLKRTAYALSRAVVTRKDDGESTLNMSEIVGSGAAAGISSTYYPGHDRTWTRTGQRWLSNGVMDSVTFAVKEFLPDVNDFLFHRQRSSLPTGALE